MDNPIAIDGYVIRTLLYYDIFDYPLTCAEVYRFLGTNSVTTEEVQQCLNRLADQDIIHRLSEFFSVRNQPELAARRVKGNKLARDIFPLAARRASLIQRFPFVRSVLASGSLSKDYMDESCDLDFFIVTARRRLWICRTLLVLYKRLFLGNSHKHFCINYFVDEDHLEIEEKNLFTATELATLIPLTGFDYYERLMGANLAWLKDAFPNFVMRKANGCAIHEPRGKRLTEKLLNIVGAALLERLWMKFTLWRWKMLYRSQYSDADFNLAFKTTAHESKNHPRNFQRRVMERYNEKVSRFQKAGMSGCL